MCLIQDITLYKHRQEKNQVLQVLLGHVNTQVTKIKVCRLHRNPTCIIEGGKKNITMKLCGLITYPDFSLPGKVVSTSERLYIYFLAIKSAGL